MKTVGGTARYGPQNSRVLPMGRAGLTLEVPVPARHEAWQGFI